MRIKQNSELPRPVLTVRGDFGDGVADLVAAKFARVARHAHQPVHSVRVDLSRHTDPAVAQPVTVAVSVDVNGHRVHATADGRTLRDAVDRVVDRVVRRLDDRFRPRRAAPVPHQNRFLAKALGPGRAGAGALSWPVLRPVCWWHGPERGGSGAGCGCSRAHSRWRSPTGSPRSRVPWSAGRPHRWRAS